jgi:rhodanese-related sulfurtransferase
MAKKLFLTLLLLTTGLFADFITLDATQVKNAMKNGTPIIDIRRADEWSQYGIIEGSHRLTFFDASGKYDAQTWLAEFTKIVKDKNQPFILVCAHANRSNAVGHMLDDQLGYKNVSELKGGINYGWIDKGLKTVQYK